MRIAICGYGHMGHELERVARDEGHTVTVRIDPHAADADAAELNAEHSADSDVAIEFSLPDAIVGNVERYVRHGLPAVIGTTGWLDRLPEVRELVASNAGSLLYGSNFSIGAHMFFALAAHAARLASAFDDYDLAIVEHHHRRKRDSPSGTALSLAEAVLANHRGKQRIVTERLDRAIAPDELHVASIRGGHQPGEHRLIVDGPADTVQLGHAARSRQGFARGALRAAQWLGGRKGVHTVEDFIQNVTGGTD